MVRRRLSLALLWPTGLVLLVGVLAFFQYKWLGQVSEAERNRLRTTLNQRAREFADDFDRDISRAYVMLQVSHEAVTARQWEPFAKRYDEWKESARFPQLVRNIFITADPASPTPLAEFDPGARSFRPVPWPDQLAPIRERLRPFTQPADPPTNAGVIRFVSLNRSPVVSDVPALLVPVQSVPRLLTAATGDVRSFGRDARYLVLELDRAFMVGTMLPALVQRHFVVDDYHVQVIDHRAPATPIFSRGVTAGTTINARDADATVPFFSVRIDSLHDVIADSAPLSAAAVGATAGAASRFSIVVEQRASVEMAARATTFQYGGGAWQLVLQHPAGSLESAVSNARRRNLALSFGVLAVLAAGVFLITINARRAERLAAQQMDFVATVSHELRTPLAVIRSAAQNLSAGVVHEAAQAKRYGDLIDAEGRRLTDMVEQVLAYAGLSGPRRPIATTPTDVVALTEDVVASCDSFIRDAGFTVEVTAADDIPPVPVDESALRRAMSNLIVNALKYGNDGLWLGVNVQLGGRRAGPAARPVTNEVQISVSDRGRGIDAQDLPHIFDAFYRGRYANDRQIHGNGLGLSLVKRVAEAHGGRASVKSTPGAGATFTLHLPL